MAAADVEPGPLQAYNLLMAFAARRGENVLRLAVHAALPQVLRVDLVHLMRLNFVPEAGHDGTIEADVLFAPFCEDLGNGYYRFGRNVRLQLLQSLDPAYGGAATLRSVQVARFLLSYIDRESCSVGVGHDRVYTDWLETERWCALGFLDPALAAAQLAAALKSATAADDVAARVGVAGLASILSTPLARYGNLLAYAAGVEALEVGRLDKAAQLLGALADAELEVEGTRLKSPHSLLGERMLRQPEMGAAPRPEAKEVPREAPPEQPARDLIFFSYSRKDQRWADEVRAAIERLKAHRRVTIWLDTSDRVDVFPEGLERGYTSAIESARVALVLLSSDYPTSDPCMYELSRLIRRTRAGELRLLWFCVRACAWQETPLAPFQPAHDPSKPLDQLAPHERELVLARIGRDIDAYLGAPQNDNGAEATAQPELERRSPERIFLVYRRDDSTGHAGRLHDLLRQRFGDQSVFLDELADIPAGEDFFDAIDRMVRASAAMIVLIGPSWLDVRNADGRRRLDDPHDFVRFEVAAALRQGVPVVPVLVAGANMPYEKTLPEDLAPLANRHALVLTDKGWDGDCERLVEVLERIRMPPEAASTDQTEAHKRGQSSNDYSSPTLAGVESAGNAIRIFISYNHADNQPFSADAEGWVTVFVHQLKNVVAKRLGSNRVEFWMDHQLEPQKWVEAPLDGRIDALIRASSCFLAILSPRYLESRLCARELDTFLSGVGGGKAGDRVFPVEILPTDRGKWHPGIQSIIAVKFWEQDFNDRAPRTLGWREPKQSGDRAYWHSLSDLAELLAVQIERLATIGRERDQEGSDASPAVRTITIFLASSDELRKDRDEFDLYLRQQNDGLRKQGVYLKIVRWENFLDAMPNTRLQNEYNEAVRNCDIFVSLFFTKTGKFSEEAFDVAHQQFKNTGRPRIYTFFKNADIKTGEGRRQDLTSLWAFQKKLKALGHFYTAYDNTEQLKRQFNDQLERLLAQAAVQIKRLATVGREREQEGSDASPAVRTITIFLASSDELRKDRDEFDLYLRQQNDSLRKQGVYLKIVRWENFLDAVSNTRLQNEYNEAVRNCDIFVSLFFTKTGKFSEEEFDTAHRQFKESGKPLIYTFFKNARIRTGSANKQDLNSLWAFQEKLSELGHFHTVYDNTEQLKRQFNDQLERLLAQTD